VGVEASCGYPEWQIAEIATSGTRVILIPQGVYCRVFPMWHFLFAG
jgi:hypothetical protein